MGCPSERVLALIRSAPSCPCAPIACFTDPQLMMMVDDRAEMLSEQKGGMEDTGTRLAAVVRQSGKILWQR
uniref:Uncharacterized protein n=1 Tax=Oryza meridionalis TaxID=40149 RepID=A0A0E0BWI0_9ORYZ